jgi:tyrosyl-tRNA synthetase
MPLLRGTDGEQKMSKSYDNYIGISESAVEQYGKTMSTPDHLLEEWIRLTAGLAGTELESALARAAADPYRAKRELAHGIAASYHGAGEADAAAAHFDRVFREHAVPDAVPEVRLAHDDERLRVEGGAALLPGLLVAAGLAASNSEAGRLLEQGAIQVDGGRVTDRTARVLAAAGGEVLLQRGRRHFVKVIFGAG